MRIFVQDQVEDPGLWVGASARDCVKRPLINRLIYHVSTFHRPAYGSAFAIFPRRSFE